MNIRELRKKRGITQEELAAQIEVHENTIRLWEKGIREPRSSDIAKLCEVLNCSEAELLNSPALQNWELKLVMSKTGGKTEGGTVNLTATMDMTAARSTATLAIGDNAMGITLSAPYELWEDNSRFEELIDDIRRKRSKGLKIRREDW